MAKHLYGPADFQHFRAVNHATTAALQDAKEPWGLHNRCNFMRRVASCEVRCFVRFQADILPSGLGLEGMRMSQSTFSVIDPQHPNTTLSVQHMLGALNELFMRAADTPLSYYSHKPILHEVASFSTLLGDEALDESDDGPCAGAAIRKAYARALGVDWYDSDYD